MPEATRPVASGPARVVELAGGVGGAKLAQGLQALLGDWLSVVVNTGDDLERHGLAIWPDHDTVMYTLAGLDDTERGWGIRDETWTAMDQLGRLGEETWFRLGDRDLATHIVRTARLAAGDRPTDVARHLQHALGVAATILPMTDSPVRTEVRADDGWLDFQTYFVGREQQPTVHEVRFGGAAEAAPTPEVLASFDTLRPTDAMVVAPSNPRVSLGPLLAIDGLRSAIAAARARGVPVIAVSGIVGGRALKGPADRMLVSLGHESSALGVARLYADWIDTFVIDTIDADLAPAIEALGLRLVVTDTIMTDDEARSRIARDILQARLP